MLLLEHAVIHSETKKRKKALPHMGRVKNVGVFNPQQITLHLRRSEIILLHL